MWKRTKICFCVGSSKGKGISIMKRYVKINYISMRYLVNTTAPYFCVGTCIKCVNYNIFPRSNLFYPVFQIIKEVTTNSGKLTYIWTYIMPLFLYWNDCHITTHRTNACGRIKHRTNTPANVECIRDKFKWSYVGTCTGIVRYCTLNAHQNLCMHKISTHDNLRLKR